MRISLKAAYFSLFYSMVCDIHHNKTVVGKHILSQINANADILEEDDRFRFVDDLTTLEIVNLIITQISSYNLFHNGYIDKKNQFS